jgi:hypothetical protein
MVKAPHNRKHVYCTMKSFVPATAERSKWNGYVAESVFFRGKGEDRHTAAMNYRRMHIPGLFQQLEQLQGDSG